MLTLWELASPKRQLSHKKVNRWFKNIALVVCSSVFVRIILLTAPVAVAYTVEQQQWGLANQIAAPFWIKALLTFILLDFIIYMQHIMFHALPFFWRFHRVHHSDLDCDVSTGLRFHPIEIVISIVIKLAAVVTLGIPVTYSYCI